MSKRVQTENLNLYAYDNLRGLPTFLKDLSDNMSILDGAYATVNGLIDSLDSRLTTAENTLEDLSPESIEDYKIRLDALEKKVVINTNAIKDINTRIGTINAQINSINVEQGVQNGRLDALESLTGNHTTRLNDISAGLTQVTSRVSTLETCCENVQHEISDMQSDINGFNDDLTVLATQFETVSGLVNDLTDLVNSLQLDVVSQRLNDIDTAINAINSDLGDVDYSSISNTISGAIVELADRIASVEPSGIEQLQEDVNTLKTTVGDNNSGLVKNVNDLQTTVGDVQSGLIKDVDVLELTVGDNSSGLVKDVNTLKSFVPDYASDVNKLATMSDIPVVPSIGIAGANQLGLIKVGSRLSITQDGTLSADEVIIPSVNIASANVAGVVKVGNRLSVTQDGTLSADNQTSALDNALMVTDPIEGEGLITFGVDANGNYGYKKVGADTVTPFKANKNVYPFQTSTLLGISFRQDKLSQYLHTDEVSLAAISYGAMLEDCRNQNRFDPSPVNYDYYVNFEWLLNEYQMTTNTVSYSIYFADENSTKHLIYSGTVTAYDGVIGASHTFNINNNQKFEDFIIAEHQIAGISVFLATALNITAISLMARYNKT